MLLLVSASDLISVGTSTTQAVDVHASWIDNASGVITFGNTNTAIVSATTTTVAPSPAVSTVRNIKTLNIANKGASSNAITVNHTNATRTALLFTVTLAAGEELQYAEGIGWTRFDVNGITPLAVATNASVGGTSAAPTGNVSTTEKAMGLGLVAGFTITPVRSGNLLVFIAGMALNATLAGNGTNITGRFGTGTAPSNAATTGLGTQFGAIQHFIASTTAGQQGFMVMGKITGQALNVPLWFDVSLLAVTGGGSTIKDAQCVALEVQ